jgi:hypothetical protein
MCILEVGNCGEGAHPESFIGAGAADLAVILNLCLI